MYSSAGRTAVILTFLFPALCLAAKSPASERVSTAEKWKGARVVSQSLGTADALFLGRAKYENAVAALSIYEKLAAAPNAGPEVLWRASMGKYFVTHRAGKLSKEASEAAYEAGLAYGRRALELAPECAPCNFWTAVNLALVSETRGPFRSLRTLKEVRALLTKTAELDPAYAEGGAHRVLGLIQTKLPRLIGGDPFEARRHFKDAIRAAPDEAMNYLALAKLEAEQFENPAAALAVIDRGLAQPKPGPERVESRDARKALASLRTKLRPR